MKLDKLLLTKDDLINDLRQGCKDPTHFRIGVEHEKFIFNSKDFHRVPYEAGIEVILSELIKFGWEGIYEDRKLIALQREKAMISLEPAGQLELSGAPLKTLHETAAELRLHLNEVKEILEPLHFKAVGLGCDPLSQSGDISWMPKDRYRLMRAYMPLKGSHGIDMMTQTCTVQVNLDFSSEEDMVRKFRVALALQPVATALFANSSITQNKVNGYESYRRFIWQNTDKDRCGFLPFVFEEGMGFERYVDYMLDVPMYFLYRNGHYKDATGLSFKEFMKGSLSVDPGHYATLKDWHDHLTVAFPEVRLKHYLEMRGADGGLEDHINALPAFWTGLLYDETSLKAAMDLVKEWNMKDLEKLYQNVAKEGLQARLSHHPLIAIARICVQLAGEGLKRRSLVNHHHQDESIYLDYLNNILLSNQTSAQKMKNDFKALDSDAKKLLASRCF